MITRVGALEGGAAGVRVNSVLPGPIEDTEGMARLAPTPELKQATIDSVPMQRYGSKQDIANCCLWLGSEAAGYVNRSEEHTSELQSLMRISYAVFCLKKKKKQH